MKRSSIYAVIIFAVSCSVLLTFVHSIFSRTGNSASPSSSASELEIAHEDLGKVGMGNSLSCISTSESAADRDKEFVINSRSGYQELLKYRFPYDPACQDFKLPEIDFSQHTLLGKYTVGEGCKIDFAKKVYRDDTNKKIIYKINITGKGGCAMAGWSMNWILVPKVPNDYQVEFRVLMRRTDE